MMKPSKPASVPYRRPGSDNAMALSTLRTRLRTETHEIHVELERALNLLDPKLTLARYGQLLQRFYGCYAPLEMALRELAVASSWRELLSQRWKTSALVADLNYLGTRSHEVERLPIAANLPALANQADAMGALYVVEGSTLGGAVLSRHFADRFGLSRDRGLAFFNVYGDRTGEMWQRYLAALADYDNDHDAERVVAAAKATFVSLAWWLTAPAEADSTSKAAEAAIR